MLRPLAALSAETADRLRQAAAEAIEDEPFAWKSIPILSDDELVWIGIVGEGGTR